MQAVHPSSRSSSIHFLHGKMFIKTAAFLSETVTVAGERQRQRERSSQLRNWDDDGGAQPQENAKE